LKYALERMWCKRDAARGLAASVKLTPETCANEAPTRPVADHSSSGASIVVERPLLPPSRVTESVL
jgi:hypothetical protein